MTAVRTLPGLAKRLGMLAVALGAVSAAQAYELKIDSLGLANVKAVEVNFAVGDDRGGIAVSNGAVYLTGDDGTARFQTSNLSSYSRLGAVYDGLFTTFGDGKVYAMAGVNNYQYSGRNLGSFNRVEVLGSPATSVALSQGIDPTHVGNIMFSGYDAGYEWNSATHDVVRIDPLTGKVTVIANVALKSPAASESWASWGVAEHFGGQDYLTYAVSGGIRRTRISDGTTEQILNANMGDMASFTIDPTSNRWYFHHEGTSDVSSRDETLGFADARITMIPDPIKAVPEPASMMLLGAGLLGAAVARRRARG